MAIEELQQVAFRFRQQLLDHETSAEKALTDAYAQSLQAIQSKLSSLYQQIDEKQQAGETIPASWLYESGRLEQIKQLILYEINKYGTTSQEAIKQLQQFAATLGTNAAVQQLRQSAPSASFGMPSPKALQEFVGVTQAGSPLADLFHSYGNQAADDVTRTLISGLTSGDNPRVIASQVARDLQIPREKALAIASTEMIRAYRGANITTFQENKKICPKWRWTCALSRRTCAACIAMDGTIHDVEEHMQSHPMCRCVPMPITVGYEAILNPLGIPSSRIKPTQPDVPSGIDWFDKQDEKTQRAILGNAKYQAWKDGKFHFSNIVGHAFNQKWGKSIYEKTLKDLVES